MHHNILFDASILVSGKLSGGLHKTGLYRVSFEILEQLDHSSKWKIWLFDNFHRERELRKYVQTNFKNCYRIKEFSFITRVLFFPFGDLADKIRILEKRQNNIIIRVFYKYLKNIFLIIEKTGKKIDKAFFTNKNLIKAIDKIDIYYSTYYPINRHALENQSIKKVYTIHDLIPIIHPEYFSSPYNEKLLQKVVGEINVNDIIFIVSESTRKDLIKLRPDLNLQNMIITPNAASDHFFPVNESIRIESSKEKYGINMHDKYFLSLSTLEPRKNLKTLVEAYERLLTSEPKLEYKLVLTGAIGWNTSILLAEIERINRKYNNKIILTGFVEDEDLAPLYSEATTFLYLSLYEGFGLPVLEAMKCGTPVITSNTSSLPEVVGDSGILVDPLNHKEVLNAIRSVINNDNFAEQLRRKSIERAAEFSWEKTTEIIISNIEKSPEIIPKL